MSNHIGPGLPPDLLEARKRKRATSRTDRLTNITTGGSVPKTDSPISSEHSVVEKIRSQTGDGAAIKVENKIQEEEDEDDDDNDCGPRLPGLVDDRYESGTPILPIQPESTDISSKQRPNWMLEPPGPDDWKHNIDTTKLKSRRFDSSRSKYVTSASSTQTTQAGSERRAELNRDRNRNRGPETSSTASVSNPGPSLYEQHQEKRKKLLVDEDHPSQRPFDKEKDMASNISYQKSKQIAMESQGLSSKFETAKFS